MKSRLCEYFGMSEGEFDALNRQLGSAQSLRGGPRTEPGVRKQQDRARRWSPGVAKAQSDMDSAQSVLKKEAAGGQVSFTPEELKWIEGQAGEYRENPVAAKVLKKVQTAMGIDKDQHVSSPAIPEPNSMARRIG